VKNIEWTGVNMTNSPSFHLQMKDMENIHIHDFEIYCDIWGQTQLSQFFGETPVYGLAEYVEKYLAGHEFSLPRLPTFPLNTDGVDLDGKNILVEKVKITNFDDAVVFKPGNKTGLISQCTENVVVRDIEVWFGVGMSIGSVSPTDDYNCVRNVSFSEVTFHHPFKSIYIKTNPGDTTSMLPGSGGEISNITYQNFKITNPIWWNIYIGPQQQK
jgi:polygalacturonase